MNLSQETIRTLLGILALAGTGIGIYVGLKEESAKTSAAMVSIVEKVNELDQYDVYLQSRMDEDKERLVRLETKVESSEKTQDRLADTMDNLGKEIRTLSDTLIRVEVINANHEKKDR